MVCIIESNVLFDYVSIFYIYTLIIVLVDLERGRRSLVNLAVPGAVLASCEYSHVNLLLKLQINKIHITQPRCLTISDSC